MDHEIAFVAFVPEVLQIFYLVIKKLQIYELNLLRSDEHGVVARHTGRERRSHG
jgi:hypothetical protein